MRTQLAAQDRSSWSFLLLMTPAALILGWHAWAVTLSPGPFCLLAISAVLASLVARPFLVRFVAACACAMALTALTTLPQWAWYVLAGGGMNFRSPLSIFTYGVVIALVYVLWRKTGRTMCAPLLVSLCALIAMVHFELAGGSEVMLAIACALLGIAIGAAGIAIRRAAIFGGAAAVLIACVFVAMVYLNTTAAGRSYTGFWYWEAR